MIGGPLARAGLPQGAPRYGSGALVYGYSPQCPQSETGAVDERQYPVGGLCGPWTSGRIR